MKQTSHTTKRLVTAAMIAAAYTAVSVCLLPLSFGAIQVRVAEALAMFSLFGPVGIWGVTLGCALTNAIGAFTGANLLGVLDILFGTGATLIAAWMSYGLRHLRTFGLPLAAAAPPILINAVIIGAEFCVLAGNWSLPVFFINALQVGLGQLISCGVLGVLLVSVFEKNQLDRRLFGVLGAA